MVEIKDLLPIGSIVRLTKATKRLMVIGVKQTQMETGDEYDYLGVIYPEGNLGGNTQIMFNHEDIEEICFRGFEDAERASFLQKLEAFFAGQTQQ